MANSVGKRIFIAGLAMLIAQTGALAYVFRTREIVGARASPGDISLTPMRIDLGTVPLGSVQSLEARALNVSKKEISLFAARDCKCLTAQLDRESIGPGDMALLSFELNAPLVPGDIQREVRVIGKEGQWLGNISVTGHADGDMWAVPPSLDLLLAGDGEATGLIRVNMKSPLRQITVEPCESPFVEVTRTDDAPRNVMAAMFNVRVRSQTSGTALLRVLADGLDAPLDIPVSWKLASQIACHPKSLALPERSGLWSDEDLNRKVLVSAEPERLDHLQTETLVTWCRIAKKARRSKRLLAITLHIDQDKMPDGFSGPILRIAAAGREAASEEILAYTE